MIISKTMNAALNGQIGHEFGASIQYTAIASYFTGECLPILAARFAQQADEERTHALKFVKYILDAGGAVEIPAIPAPKSGFKSAEEAVALSVGWEKKVTQQINGLMELSLKETDFASQSFLNWFINEQVEEVSSMETLLKMIQRAGEANLLYVEGYLAGQMKSGSPKASGAQET
jgi:bacterioferritin B